MKRITLQALMALVLTAGMMVPTYAQAYVDPTNAATSSHASAWQESAAGKAALSKITYPEMAKLLKNAKTTLPALFAAIKPDCTASPIKATQIGALSQFVMTRFGAEFRPVYADALFAAAKDSTDDYVTTFFLDQLRWCGLARQSVDIVKLAETRSDHIKEIARIANLAVVGDISSKYKTKADVVPTITEAEKAVGFVSIFNGKDLTGWTCSTPGGYAVDENGILYCCTERDGQPFGGGNMMTTKEYSNFVLRFDFKLPPNANNGLGIHYPGKGDAAFDAIELQILDDSGSNFHNKLADHQYHGSLYGVAAAKRGALKPVGQWNSQEVRVNGTLITVILNGQKILDVDIKGMEPLDGEEHPGLKRTKGFISWLGHGSRVEWRNIRIKELN